MTSLPFTAPVKVEANGAIHTICTIRDAMDFLRQWPSERRGPLFSCAERSCNAAIAGQISVKQAQDCFASFAKLSGILVGSLPLSERSEA